MAQHICGVCGEPSDGTKLFDAPVWFCGTEHSLQWIGADSAQRRQWWDAHPWALWEGDATSR